MRLSFFLAYRPASGGWGKAASRELFGAQAMPRRCPGGIQASSALGFPLSRFTWSSSWAVVFMAVVTGARAAAPEAKYLFPPGAARGATVEVAAGGYSGEWPAHVWTNRAGVSLAAAAEKGKLSATIAADAVPGLCLVRIYNADGAATPLPFIIGTLPEVNEQEPNDSPAKAQKIEGTVRTINGRLEKRGDVDCFAVSLRPGQTLVAAVAAHQSLASPMDAVLQIANAQGIVLMQSDDERGLDPLLAFTAPAEGVYLVRTFAFPATPDASIGFAGGETFTYRLTLTTGGFLDAALPLAVSSPGPAKVVAYGWNIGDAEAKRAIDLTLDHRAVELFSPNWAGSLTLPVAKQPSSTETEPNDVDRAQPFQGPAEISGRIAEPGDRDAFRIQLTKGQAWQFAIESRQLGYPLDAVLEVLDAAGKSLARADDNGTEADPRLSFTAPADGEYRLVVSDLFGHGGRRFFYRLSLAPAEPDFSLTLPRHSFVVKSGTPAEVAVAVERTQGFAGDIELKAVGLPEGVTAAAVKSVANGDTAKSVKLVLTAARGAYSGPIQVIGATTQPPARSHAATLKLPSGALFSDLWITVVPP